MKYYKNITVLDRFDNDRNMEINRMVLLVYGIITTDGANLNLFLYYYEQSATPL